MSGDEGEPISLEMLAARLQQADPLRSPNLIAIAMTVGVLCQEWAALEASVSDLLRAACGMPRNQVSTDILRCFDFRDQLRAIKVAAVSRSRNADWIDEAVNAADYIDNTLRNRRNRLVHDLWRDHETAPHAIRTNPAPVISKPQARQPREVRRNEEAVETIDDVTASLAEIRLWRRHVEAITNGLIFPGKWNYEVLRRLRPQPPPPRPQPETPRRRGIFSPRRKPPPKS